MILLAFNIRQELNETKFNEAISWLETKEERERILRFKFENDRRLALASQLLRRYVFVRYYGMTLDSLEFVQEQKGGKPKLLGFNNLYDFNVSHQGDWVILIATNQFNQKVGIDIVTTDSMSSMSSNTLINTFTPQLAPKELKMLQNHAYPIETFYALWSLKESYIKALGIGLYMDLHNLCFQNDIINNKIELIIDDKKKQGVWQFQLYWLDLKSLCAICYSTSSTVTDETLLNINDLSNTQLIGDPGSSHNIQHPFTLVTFSDLMSMTTTTTTIPT